MANFGGVAQGFLDWNQQNQQRQMQGMQMQGMLQWIAQNRQKQQQEQDARRLDLETQGISGSIWQDPDMIGGPASPPPGAASVPMVQQGNLPSPPPGGAPPGMSMAPNVGQNAFMPPPIAPAALPQMSMGPSAPPIEPWKSIATSIPPAPPMGGMGGPSQSVGAPPIMPVSEQGVKDGVMPRQMDILDRYLMVAQKHGLSSSQFERALKNDAPIIAIKQKTELDRVRAENAQLKLAEQQRKDRETEDYRRARLAERERNDRAREEEQARRDRELSEYRRGRTRGSGVKSAVATAPSVPLDDSGKIALDMQSWNYINKGILPYRKGTGGGKDRNDAVIQNAGKIAKDIGLDGQQLSAQSAEFKSNAQALYFITKKLAVVESVLSGFHNNIATWEAAAKGLPPQLGGEKLASIAKDLHKISFTDVKTLNDWKLKIQTQFNDPSTVAYVTAAFTVAMDYARILSSQGQSAAMVTDSARAEAERMIASGYNDKARMALIGTLESDAMGAIKGMKDQREKLQRQLGMGGTSRRPAGGWADPSTSAPKKNPIEMSNDELLRALQGG